MMSRASRVLKWVGAVTVLLAAAPIAYAAPAVSVAGPQPQPAGTSSVAGLTNTSYEFSRSPMWVQQPYFGDPADFASGTITVTVTAFTSRRPQRSP